MKSVKSILFPAVLCGITNLHAVTVKTTIARTDETAFSTETTPAPATNDAATEAVFKIISGDPDRNSADLKVLHDGKIPSGGDEPGANFFFAQGGQGGRITVDLGKTISISSIAAYSWHTGSRAAQNFDVWVSDGKGISFDAEPEAPEDPKEKGWFKMGKVETSSQQPGQHASVLSPERGKSLGKFRYVLFDIRKNANPGPFNDTFFSEIDISEAQGPELVRIEAPKKVVRKFDGKHGDFKYTLDLTEAPDLEEWSAEHLIPVMDEWYPKIIAMLPVKGVKPAGDITFTLKKATELPGHLRGVPAYASGNSVVFNADFMRKQMNGEAIGAGVHEIVHVVQFGGDQGPARMPQRPPTWVTEGVADYIRWFLYEPESKGAEITPGNYNQANYDSSYRITANFFDFVIKNYEKDLMRKLNAATREGYSEDLWKEWCGKSLQDLGTEWKDFHKKKLGIKN